MFPARHSAVLVDFLVSLRRRLGRRYRHLDEHVLDDSIEDTLLHHLASPELFEANRGVSLLLYLELWARSYLDRRLRKLKRRHQHERAIGASAEILEKFASENGTEWSIYLQSEESNRERETQRQALDALAARLPPEDRAKIELLRGGASLEEWTHHLGIEHLPLEERRHKVYGEKDRLKKKLKRLARKLQGGDSPWINIQQRSDNRSPTTTTGGSDMKTWMGVLVVMAAIVAPPVATTILMASGGTSNDVTITHVVVYTNPEGYTVVTSGSYDIATGYSLVGITVYVMPTGGAAGEGGSGAATANQGGFGAGFYVPAGTYDVQAMLTVTDSSGNPYYFFSALDTGVSVPPPS